MTKSELSAYLGRPLTPVEDTNFDLYLELAQTQLETLLCTRLGNATETRVFTVRDGYTTAFIDIFRSVSEVKIDGVITTAYEKRQWDNSTGEWFNSLVFSKPFRQQKLEVTAVWGFETYPKDLDLLLAGVFNLISQRQSYDPTIESKRVEDFHISFKETDLEAGFARQYSPIIGKYSLCHIPNIQHGGC